MTRPRSRGVELRVVRLAVAVLSISTNSIESLTGMGCRTARRPHPRRVEPAELHLVRHVVVVLVVGTVADAVAVGVGIIDAGPGVLDAVGASIE